MLQEVFIAFVSLNVLLEMSKGATRYYVGLFAFFILMFICSVWGVLIAIPMTLIGRRYDVNYLVARTFYELASRWLNITVTVEGEEYLDTQPAMFVANHQSVLDILYLAK